MGLLGLHRRTISTAECWRGHQNETFEVAHRSKISLATGRPGTSRARDSSPFARLVTGPCLPFIKMLCRAQVRMCILVSAVRKAFNHRPFRHVPKDAFVLFSSRTLDRTACSEFFVARRFPADRGAISGGSSLPNARRICEPKIGCSTTYHGYFWAGSDSSSQSSAPLH